MAKWVWARDADAEAKFIAAAKEGRNGEKLIAVHRKQSKARRAVRPKG